MMKGDHGPTKLLHALTWGAFDHASRAPQVRACNYYLHGMHIQCVHIYLMLDIIEISDINNNSPSDSVTVPVKCSVLKT